MFEKEDDERQAQAGFPILNQGGNQARRLFVQGLVLALPAQDKVDIQTSQHYAEWISAFLQ